MANVAPHSNFPFLSSSPYVAIRWWKTTASIIGSWTTSAAIIGSCTTTASIIGSDKGSTRSKSIDRTELDTLTNNNLSESENKEIKMDSRSSCEFVDIELGSDEITSKSMHLVFEKRYNTEGNQRRTNGSACKKQKQRKHIVTTNDISCIICFEDFSVDDTIVWSENNECPHFYHRKCMIDYLASKRQKKKIITDHSDDDAYDISGTERTIDDGDDEHNTIIEDNPCPTCRRNFCSITMKDLNIVKS
jgi:hypothetical protein